MTISELALHPAVKRSLYCRELVTAFVRQKNPRRGQAARHLDEFHQRIWREAAEDLGASYTLLGNGFAEIGLDGRRTRVFGRLAPLDDPVTLALTGHKPMSYRMLAEAGLPIPRHAAFSFSDAAPAVRFLRDVGRCCVVKPAVGTGGGRAVTTGIERPAHLARAVAAAAVYCDDLLIEEQVDGQNYRLLYFDGQLLDAFVRQPPTVLGNGRDTVAALLRQANLDRFRSGADASQAQLVSDLDLRLTLARQGLTLHSVPAAGMPVVLKTVVNENAAGENVVATHLLCDSLVAAGAKAARTLNVRLAGVDVITRDPSVPLEESGGVVLEVNTTPNLYYHYRKQGGACPIAHHVLRRLLSTEAGASSPSEENHVSGRRRQSSGTDRADSRLEQQRCEQVEEPLPR